MPTRPFSIKTFEPTNPEYALLDSMIEESYEAVSPEIYWWCFKTEELYQPESEIHDPFDQLYGEISANDQETLERFFMSPKRVYGNVIFNPILNQIAKLTGGQEIREIDLYFNISALEYYLGQSPKRGDILRITHLGKNEQVDREYIWYEVANITPVDQYNLRYTGWEIHCEQTTLHNVPDIIKKFNYGD